MIGSVQEWTLDAYHDSYKGAPKTQKPRCKTKSCRSKKVLRRVARGGSWYDEPNEIYNTTRFAFDPDSHIVQLGFRIALSK